LNGLSVSLSGVGTYSSTAAISSTIFSSYSASPSSALSAEPFTTGTSSPGKSYSVNRSRTSISTSSNSSSSSTISVLLRNTTIEGTPTLRDSKMCSRVCGIGPSADDTTRKIGRASCRERVENGVDGGGG